ncbi:MAG: LCP family protein [Candidatus Gracilibacteria bacterium]
MPKFRRQKISSGAINIDDDIISPNTLRSEKISIHTDDEADQHQPIVKGKKIIISKKEHLPQVERHTEDRYGEDRYNHGFIDRDGDIYVSSHDLESKHRTPKIRHESSFSLFIRSFFSWMGVFATIVVASIFISRMLGGAYWSGIQSFFAPIFVNNIETQEKTGFFDNLSLPNILKDLPPVSKFANTTFLVVGIGGAGHDGGNLTDSIQIIHLADKPDHATLVSIPRDLYVSMSNLGLGNPAKINELYARSLKLHNGDKELALGDLSKKITEITGQQIDHVALIDFSGFIQFIDLIGGIEIDVPKSIVDMSYPDNNYGYQVFRINAGKQILDGKTALKYVRSRHSTSDFDRSVRQQLVLQAIRDKVFSVDTLTSPSKIQDLYDSLKEHVWTDLDVTDLGFLAVRAKDVHRDAIYATNINESCYALNMACQAGGLLYTPNRDLTAGAWTLLPQGATLTQVSKYEYITQFITKIFAQSSILSSDYRIRMYTTQSAMAQAYTLRQALIRSGYQFDQETLKQLRTPKTTSTGSISDSIPGFDKNGFEKSVIVVLPTASDAMKKVAEYLSQDTHLPVIEGDISNFPWYDGVGSVPDISILLAPGYKFSLE